MDIFLHPDQITAMIKQAEAEDEVIVIRCRRKTAASKPGGSDAGQFYDLHCAAKPKKYKSASTAGFRTRKEEDKKNGVLTVYVVNRRDERTGLPGAWRRINLNEVVKVIYKTREWSVTIT